MIKFQHKTKKAFSLIELLVAVTIFAMALVIAFGAFTLTLGNQSFVQANADVNTEGDRIMRQISDDIIKLCVDIYNKLANGEYPGKVKELFEEMV